jgi:hypothetical protein
LGYALQTKLSSVFISPNVVFQAGRGTHMKQAVVLWHHASIQSTPIPCNNGAAISVRHASVWKLTAYPPRTHTRPHARTVLYFIPLIPVRITIIAALGTVGGGGGDAGRVWVSPGTSVITWGDHAFKIAYRINPLCVRVRACFNNNSSFVIVMVTPTVNWCFRVVSSCFGAFGRNCTVLSKWLHRLM